MVAPQPSVSAAPQTKNDAGAAARAPLNVLVLVIDSLRADMPWAGYPRQIAPHIDAFRAQNCVTYLEAYSISSYTAKSVAPLLAGEYPSAMARDGWFFTRYADKPNLFVSERARSAGDRSLAGTAHGYFLPVFGLNQGFDDYRTLHEGVDLQAVHSVTSEPLTKLAIEMLSDPKNTKLAGDKRFFAYFHYMDPHHTYEQHAGHPHYGLKPRDLYDNEVHYTDAWVGKLLDFAEQREFWDQTAVIITADHGEGFGEHGQYRHGFELWESLIRVPLLVCLPNVAPRVIDHVRRSHIDLAPTVADLMRLPAEPGFRGKSLVPEITGAEKPEPRRIVADLPRADLMDRRRAVIDGDTKIIAFGDDRVFQLYDLANDPWEEHDLSRERPDELERMKRIYQEESEKIPLVEVTPGVNLKGAPAGRRW